MIFINGEWYEGEWKDELYDGYGVHKEIGGKYKGEFKRGLKNGKGEYIDKDNNIYVG